MEVIELRRHLNVADCECVTEAGRPMILVSDASMVIVDLGMPPIPRTHPPPDQCMANDVLDASGTIL
jgi:hypothetical protein